MAHMRIGVYTMAEGQALRVIQSAAETLAPQLQREPGFLAYELVLTGPDSVVSCTTWESAAQAEAAVGRIARWVERTVPGTVLKRAVTGRGWRGGGDGVRLSVEVPEDRAALLRALDELSRTTGRPRSEIALEALEAYLATGQGGLGSGLGRFSLGAMRCGGRGELYGERLDRWS
jgi:quinol monooxygenase YgiN